jgi:hypothetical protein
MLYINSLLDADEQEARRALGVLLAHLLQHRLIDASHFSVEQIHTRRVQKTVHIGRTTYFDL